MSIIETGTSSPSAMAQPKAESLNEAIRYSLKQNIKDRSGDFDFSPEDYAKAVSGIPKAQAQKIEDKISVNLKRSAKLKEFKELAMNLQKQAASLSNYLGPDRDRTNLWKYKISKVSGTNKDSIHVTASPTADVGSFTVNVLQKARPDIKVSSVTFANATTALNVSGQLSIAGQNIAVTQNMTLQDIANAVNQLTPQTDVKMIILDASGGQSQFQIFSTKFGAPIILTGTNGTLATNLGLTTQATNANTLDLQVQFNGQTITKSDSNILTNILPGVNIEILGENTGNIDCTIDYDRDLIRDGVNVFTLAYNKLQEFAAEQTAYENDKFTPKSDTYLHHSTSLRQLLQTTQQTLIQNVRGLSGLNNLGGIGLQVGSSDFNSGSIGTLQKDIIIDQVKLDQLLHSDNFTQVLGTLGNQVTVSNNAYTIYQLPDLRRNPTLAASDQGVKTVIQLSLQKDGTGTLQATLTANGQALSADVSVNTNGNGALIKGAVGSIYEGFAIGVKQAALDALTSGGQAATTNISVTQGVFSALEQSLSAYLKDQIGSIDAEYEEISKISKKDTEEVDKLTKQAQRDYERTLTEMNALFVIKENYESSAKTIAQYMDLLTSRN